MCGFFFYRTIHCLAVHEITHAGFAHECNILNTKLSINMSVFFSRICLRGETHHHRYTTIMVNGNLVLHFLPPSLLQGEISPPQHTQYTHTHLPPTLPCNKASHVTTITLRTRARIKKVTHDSLYLVHHYMMHRDVVEKNTTHISSLTHL